MSSSQAVKDWRNRTKERIVEAMGGECALCGYKKCQWALALHHLEPEHKDFSFGAIRASCKSWATIVEELRKCILVCHNCHSELHAGITKVPKHVHRFDESYVTYTPLNKPKDSCCPVCNQLKPSYQITCSKQCAAKNRYQVDWDRVDLQTELKSKSIIQLSRELGCSDGTIHKRLKRLGLK